MLYLAGFIPGAGIKFRTILNVAHSSQILWSGGKGSGLQKACRCNVDFFFSTETKRERVTFCMTLDLWPTFRWTIGVWVAERRTVREPVVRGSKQRIKAWEQTQRDCERDGRQGDRKKPSPSGRGQASCGNLFLERFAFAPCALGSHWRF